MARLTILTGASRGLGLAMARQLLRPGDQVVCISRHFSDELAQQADLAGAALAQWTIDLAQSADAAGRMAQWLGQRTPGEFDAASLINNAGAITSVAPARNLVPADVWRALAVGLQAPMHLCTAFLRATLGWPCTRKILNISSGLARRAMASQSTYCAAKAGLDHFTRCLALEEAAISGGARVCALSPGGIDSDMMAQLRDADPASFPDHGQFVEAKAAGRLLSPEVAARRVLAFLDRSDFGADAIADLRDFPSPGA